MRIHTYKNNHVGGFARWSIVKLSQKDVRHAHTRNAFLYTCADQDVRRGGREYYRHAVRVPEVYDDGVYVLGWVWYGGAIRTGLQGAFGDYYDCMYIRIRGGGFRKEERATFRMGKSVTGARGRCRATVDDVGICYREPCPGGTRRTALMVPKQFRDGRAPGVVKRDWFRVHVPSTRPPTTAGSAGRIVSMQIRFADKPHKVYIDSKRGSVWLVRGLVKPLRLVAFCIVQGSVPAVGFFVNGRLQRVDRRKPYSSTGEYGVRVGGKVVTRYRAWVLQARNAVYNVACRAGGEVQSVRIATFVNS